jgi:hypothetical protein
MRMIVEGVPKFATEKEEAEWWDANPDLVTELFLRADTEGRFERGSASNGSSPKPTPRIALTAEDLAKSKKLTGAKSTDRAA